MDLHPATKFCAPVWPEFAAAAVGPLKMPRFASGEFRVTLGLPFRPNRCSLNMAVFDSPSLTPWNPTGPTYAAPGVPVTRSELGTIVPEYIWIAAGPP